MTVANAAPVTVAPSSTGDASFQVPIPTGAPQQVGWALVVNQSAYTLEISQGSTPLGWLPAGISNAYPLGSVGTPITLTVPAGTAAAPTGLAPQVVYVTYSDTQPPGQWPAGINTAQLSAAVSNAVTATVSGAVLLENQQIGSWPFPAVGGSGASTSFNIPANVHSVKLFVEAASALSGSLTVVGNQSGFHYLDAYPLSQNLPIALPFGDAGIDTSWTLSVHSTNIGGTIFVMGSSDPSLIPVTTLQTDPLSVAPQRRPTTCNTAQASGNTVTLLSVPSGFTFYVFAVGGCIVPPAGGVQGSIGWGGGSFLGLFGQNSVAVRGSNTFGDGGFPLVGPQTVTISTAAGSQFLGEIFYA